MNTIIRGALFVIFSLGLFSCGNSEEKHSSKKSNSDMSSTKILSQAYLYGYPLLTMHFTQLNSTNVEVPNKRAKAPINQFACLEKFPKAGFKDVVRPNLDTYYSLIWTDLSKEPLYIFIPATERYYLIPILNAYTDVVASLGSRTTGQGDLHVALVGPNYKEELPEDLTVVRSNTNLNWLLGRLQVDNDEDGKIATKNFQNKLEVRPLSERNNKDYVAPKGIVKKENTQVPMHTVDNLGIEEYFNLMLKLMVANPAQQQDTVLLQQLASIGLKPGGTFDLSKFTDEEQAVIKEIPKKVQAGFAQKTAKPDTSLLQNGWMVLTGVLGEYGTNYATRAYIAKIGLGANTDKDAIYPNSAQDMSGNILSSKKKYVLHFDADKLPPMKGFWSITMYDKEGFLVDNPIDRYNLGNRKDLMYNEDGSLDIYIQSEPPKGKESNWLPAPQDGSDFELTFRIYWPDESVLNRTWQIPGVTMVE